MANDDKDFLARWARLKREHAARPDGAQSPAPVEKPPELPPLDQLTPESDFKGFMHAKVKDSVRRAALKKLFADPRFNVMDDLDIYIGDYRDGGVISPEMLADLEHSKTTLFGPKQDPQAQEPEGGVDGNVVAPQVVETAPQGEEIRADVRPAEESAQPAEPAPHAQRDTEEERKENGDPG